MKFTFPRDREIASMFGQCIAFKKGEATYVPPAMYQEVMAAGGVPDEELDLSKPAPKNGVVEPTAPDEREMALFIAFEAMVLRAKREEFSASGLPHPKALAAELGWTVPNKERDLAWVKFQTSAK